MMQAPTESASLDPRAAESFDAQKQFFERESAAAAARRLTRLTSVESLLLAVVPNWTEALVRVLPAVAKIEQAPSAERLLALVSEGWLERFQSPLPKERTPERVRFAMPASLRHEVLTAITDAPDRASTAWLEVSQLGKAIFAAKGQVKVPEDTALWAELSQFADDPWRLAIEFDSRVRSQHDSSGIHRLIGAVTRLLPLYKRGADSTVEMALERAGRRLEMLRRKDDDRAHLTNFLEREEQMAAVRKLVAGDDDHWALHLVGPGGVGKTMLLRHLTTNFSDDRFAVSRVDFDYLNPDFPRLAPGLLLWSFGQDLRDYAPDDPAVGVLSEANQMLEKLHQELKANQAPDDLAPLDHPIFKAALQAYIDFIGRLGLRALLVLDTCEELARVRPDGTVPDNVRDTFRILEMLHQGAPGLRVLFSGRRLLASRGDGWRVSSSSELPERAFLSLHEVRGFTPTEAQAYLERAAVPAALQAAIIRRCPEVGRVIDVVWDEPSASAGEARLNPYDLRLFAEWAGEKPHPSAEMIASSTDSNYIEYRIIRRLRSPALVQLLPVIAVLGHIDNHVLAELADLAPADPRLDHLERSLRQQEWTGTRGVIGPAGEETRRVYTVDPALRARLLEHSRRNRAEWAPLLDRALALMTRNTTGLDLTELDWTDFDATLAAFDEAGRPEQAAQWWDKVEQRLTQRNDHAWTRDLLGFLSVTVSGDAAADGAALGADPASTPPADGQVKADASARDAIRPAVLATYATALQGAGAAAGSVADHWRTVLATVRDFPTPAGRARLLVVATAGLLQTDAAPRPAGFDAVAAAVAGLGYPDFDPSTASALVAAAEWALDRLEMAGPDAAPDALPIHTVRFVHGLHARVDALARGRWQDLDHGPRGDPQALVAWMNCLADRAWMWTSARAEHLGFDRTLALARGLGEEFPVWPHWRPAASLKARIALDYARHAMDLGVAPAKVLAEIERVVEDVMSGEETAALDRQLLLGVALRLSLADAPPLPHTVALLRKSLGCSPRAGNGVVQRAVTPLCCVAAEALAAHGLVDEPIARMRELLRDSSRFAEETRRAFERTYLRIVARLRLFEVGEGRVESLHASTDPGDILLKRTVDALAGAALPLRPDKPDPELEHVHWQTFRLTELPQERAELIRWLADLSRQERQTLVLDAMECTTLLGLAPAPREDQDAYAGVALQMSDPVAYWRATLRIMALGGARPASAPLADRLRDAASSLGRRRAAEIALDEADLMSLRLPTQAVSLALAAFDGFEQASDAIGMLRAGISAVLCAGPGADLPPRLQGLAQIWDSVGTRAATPCWKPLAARVRLILPRLPDKPDLDPSSTQLHGTALPPPPPPPPPVAGTAPGAVAGEEPLLEADWALASSDLRRWREPPAQVPKDIRAPVRSALVAVGGAAVAALGAWLAYLHRFSVVAPAPAPYPSPLDNLATPGNPTPPAYETAALPSFDIVQVVVALLLLFGVLSVWSWRQWWLPRWVRQFTKELCSASLAFCALLLPLQSLSAGTPLGYGVALGLIAVAAALRRLLIWSGAFMQAPAWNRWLPWLYTGLPILGVVAALATRSELFSVPLLGFAAWRFWAFVATRRATRQALRWSARQSLKKSGRSVSVALALEPGTALNMETHGSTTLFPAVAGDRRGEDLLSFESARAWGWQEAYTRFIRSFEPDPLPMLRRLPRLLKLRPAHIDIDALPLSLHAFPWEALAIIGAGDRPANPREVPICCLRRVRPRRSRRPVHRSTARPSGAGAIAVLGARSKRLAWVAEEWAGRFARVQTDLTLLEPSAATAASEADDTPTVAHLIGIPYEDSGGLRLRLSQDGSGHLLASDVMVRMEDVVARLPALSLCVLQILPLASGAELGAHDRRRVGLMRVLAAELIDLCGASVLVLPPLPGDLARTALKEIALQIPFESPDDPASMRRLVAQLSHRIAAEMGRSTTVREVDVDDPAAIARRLAEPRMRAVAGHLSEAGRAALGDFERLPRESLAGLLTAQLNQLLATPELWSTPGARGAGLRAWWGWRPGESIYRFNRRLLDGLFGRALSDGRARVLDEAMDAALGVCGFVADDTDGPGAVEVQRATR